MPLKKKKKSETHKWKTSFTTPTKYFLWWKEAPFCLGCTYKSHLLMPGVREMNGENRRQDVEGKKNKKTTKKNKMPACKPESQQRGNHKACSCLNSLHIPSRFPKKSAREIVYCGSVLQRRNTVTSSKVHGPNTHSHGETEIPLLRHHLFQRRLSVTLYTILIHMPTFTPRASGIFSFFNI